MNALIQINNDFLIFSKGLAVNYINHVSPPASNKELFISLAIHDTLARIFSKQVGQIISLHPAAQQAFRIIPLFLTLASYSLSSEKLNSANKQVARFYQAAILTSTVALLFLGPPKNHALLLAGFTFSTLSRSSILPKSIGSDVEKAMYIYLSIYQFLAGNILEKGYVLLHFLPD